MISFKNVSYKVNNKIILSSITFNIKDNEKVLIMGPSGSGKSTIFNLLLKNILPTSGQIYFDLENIENLKHANLNYYRQEKIIMISQKDDLFDNLTVFDNLTMFYYVKDVLDILKKANLLALKDRYVYSLSGGERQRIAILKACLASYDVLLCDEITSALDHTNALKILDFIFKMFQRKTIIFISHDKDIFTDKIDHFIYLENHSITQNVLINDITNNKNKAKNKPKKSLLLLSFFQGFKKLSLALFILFILTTLCFYISLNFNDIFQYFASSSYQKYFDYDVVEVKDNKDILPNNEDIFISLDEVLNEASISINNIKRTNIKFKPFNNKNHSQLVVSKKFLEIQNIDKIFSFEIKSSQISQSFVDVDVIEENNLFSTTCVYYDIKYFSSLKINSSSFDVYILGYDFTKLDERFTNNPLFENKKEDKPYLESTAYDDYLTFQMIFQGLESMTNYYFIIITIFAMVILLLINFSRLLKDVKVIAIYLSRGYNDFEILLSYMLAIILYFIFFLVLVIFIPKLLISLCLSLLLQLIAIILAYYFLKSKDLYTLLKEETLS